MNTQWLPLALAAWLAAPLLSAQDPVISIEESLSPPTTATLNSFTSTEPIWHDDGQATWHASDFYGAWTGVVGVDPGGDQEASLISRYRINIEVEAEAAQAWELDLQSDFVGKLINVAAGTETGFTTIQGSLVSGGWLHSGSLDVPIETTLVGQGVKTVEESSTAIISGYGPSTVVLAYEFEAHAKSDGTTGFECLARFGKHPTGFDYYDQTGWAQENEQLECHVVTGTVRRAPVIVDVQKPSCPGGYLVATVDGTGPFEYTLSNGPDGSFFFIIDQQTSDANVYTYPVWGDQVVRLTVTNALGQDVSDWIYLDVEEGVVPPQPPDVTACENSTVLFTTPQYFGSTYTWTNYTRQVTGASAALHNVKPADEGTWYLIAFNPICGQYIEEFELNVIDTYFLPTPPSVSACAEGSVTFTTPDNPDWSFSWSNGMTTLEGATVTLNDVPLFSELWTLTATNGICGVQSKTFQLLVTSPLTLTPPPVDACAGSPVTFSTPDEPGWFFTWSHGTTTLTGASASFVPTPADAGSWTLTASHSVCNPVSQSFTLSVGEVDVAITSPSSSFQFCPGITNTLEATVSLGLPPYTYAWTLNGDDYGTTESVAVNETGTYAVTVTDSNGCVASAWESIVVSGETSDAIWHDTSGGGVAWNEFFLAPPVDDVTGNWFADGLPTCPPTGRALISGGFGDEDIVLAAGEQWALENLEMNGDPDDPIALEIQQGARLEATVKSEVTLGGSIRLAGGELAGPETIITDSAWLEGYGTIGGPLTIDEDSGNIGSLSVPAPTSGVTGETLTVDETLTSSGIVRVLEASSSILRINNSSLESVALHNKGSATIELGDKATLVIGSGEAHNEGTIELNCALLTVTSDDDIINTGLIEGTGAISTGGTLINDKATIHVKGGILEVRSDLVNEGTIAASGSGAELFIDGSLTGGGSVVANVCTGAACASSCAPPPPSSPPSPPRISVQDEIVLEPMAQLAFGDGTIEVLGDFRSKITDPFAFDLSAATLQMNGISFLGTQELALATPDLGVPASLDAPAYFTIGNLQIGPNPAEVVLTSSVSSATPALYTKRLTVSAFNRLHLGNAVVYADEVEVEPGGEIFLGGGTLLAGSVFPADACAQGLITGNCGTQLLALPAPDCDGNGVDDAIDIAFGAPDCNGNGIPDACDIALGISFDQDGEGTPDDCQSFHVDRPWLSIQAGGTQSLNLHAGAPYAAGLYVVAGSATGTAPAIPFGGVTVPLLFDNYTLMTLGGANLPPFVDTTGFLDSAGAAQAAIELGPDTVPASGIGLVLHHAYVVLDPASGVPTLASNPTSLELRP